MIRKILMILVPILCFLGGAVGGGFLHTPPEAAEAQGENIAEGAGTSDQSHAASSKTSDKGATEELGFFRFPTQFFVPIMRNGDVNGTMILSLTVEMPKAAQEKVFGSEHRLRDGLLRALMIHANTGGFDGNFTSDAQMDRLRAALLKAARDTEPEISLVLVEDIAFQKQAI